MTIFHRFQEKKPPPRKKFSGAENGSGSLIFLWNPDVLVSLPGNVRAVGRSPYDTSTNGRGHTLYAREMERGFSNHQEYR